MSRVPTEIYSIDVEKYKFYQPPNVVGYWALSSNFLISVSSKPNWFHRKMITLVFGWEWRDKI